MTKRACLEPGCPAITDKRRCTEHARAKDKARGTRIQRGYDKHHDALRASYQRRMNAGETFVCASVECRDPGHLVDPNDWHLGHTRDRTAWTGPEVPGCNLSQAGRDAHRLEPQ